MSDGDQVESSCAKWMSAPYVVLRVSTACATIAQVGGWSRHLLSPSGSSPFSHISSIIGTACLTMNKYVSIFKHFKYVIFSCMYVSIYLSLCTYIHIYIYIYIYIFIEAVEDTSIWSHFLPHLLQSCQSFDYRNEKFRISAFISAIADLLTPSRSWEISVWS